MTMFLPLREAGFVQAVLDLRNQIEQQRSQGDGNEAGNGRNFLAVEVPESEFQRDARRRTKLSRSGKEQPPQSRQ